MRASSASYVIHTQMDGLQQCTSLPIVADQKLPSAVTDYQ